MKGDGRLATGDGRRATMSELANVLAKARRRSESGSPLVSQPGRSPVQQQRTPDSEFHKALTKARRRSETSRDKDSPTALLERKISSNNRNEDSSASSELQKLLSRQEEKVIRHEAALSYAKQAGISVSHVEENSKLEVTC